MTYDKTVNVMMVKPLVEKLYAFGVERRLIEQETKLPLLIEELSQDRVPYQLSLKLNLMAVRYGLIDETFIHRSISSLDPQHLDWVYATFLAGHTLREAINNFIYFHRLLGDCEQYHLVEQGSLAKIYLNKSRRISDLSLTIHDEIGNFGILAKLIRCYLNDPKQAIIAYFPCRMMNQQTGSSIDELFLSPVSYGAGISSIEFPRELLDISTTNINPGLNTFVLNKAKQELTQFPISHSFASKIKQMLQKSLSQGKAADIEVICQQLNTSRWSLNRWLQQEETSFRQLSEDVKKEMALSLVLQQRLPSLELAYMLGYSEQSAFNRAFKRWYGIGIRELLNK